MSIYKAIDEERLNTLKDLGDAFLLELFSGIEEQLGEHLSLLNGHIKEGKEDAARASAHALKSMCLNIGAKNLSLLAQEVEEDYAKIDVSRKFVEITEESEVLKIEIKSLLGSLK